MSDSVLIWDCEDTPANVSGDILYWRDYASHASSVPQYLENNAERLRSRYLAFIYDLGQTSIRGRRIVSHLSGRGGFSFWWMTLLAEKNPLKSPQIYDCMRLLALEEIFLKKKPATVCLASPSKELAQAIRRMCNHLAIHFTWQRQPEQKKWSLRSLYSNLPYSLQGLVSVVRYVIIRWPLRNLTRPVWFGEKKAVFLCSYFIHLDTGSCASGSFQSRQWGMLPQYIRSVGKETNWLHHFLFSREVFDVQTGLTWLRLFNKDAKEQGNHAFLDSYLSWRTISTALSDWLRLNIANWRLRSIKDVFCPAGSSVWLWPVLQDDWKKSLVGSVSVNNCLCAALFDAALRDVPRQSNGFYIYENQGWERAFLHSWRKYGHGRIVGVQHATVPFWYLGYFDDSRSWNEKTEYAMSLPDYVAVNGTMARKDLEAGGYPSDKLLDVEALRYLNISPKPSRKSGQKVLILGDMIPESMHNFLSMIENAVGMLAAGYKFTFKPHPGYYVPLANYPGLDASEITDGMDRILGEYDVAVTANGTSAAVDAYIAGLPVIIMLNGTSLNLSPLRGHPDVQFVSTSEELATALQRAILDTIGSSRDSSLLFLDTDMPRWKRLLSTDVNNIYN